MPISWQSDGSERDRKIRRRLIALLALILLIVAGFSARPAYRTFRAWRASGLIEEAQKLRLEGNLKLAMDKAVTARQLDLRSPGPLREMAIILMYMRHQGTLQLWKELDKMTNITDEDRRNWARALLMWNEPIRAERIMDSRSGPDTSEEDIVLRVQIAMAMGNKERAVELGLEAQGRYPENRQIALLLAKSLQNLGDERSLRKAKRILRELSEDGSLYGKEAEKILNALSGEVSADSALKTRLDQTPIQELLTTLDSELTIAEGDVQREAVLAKAEQPFKDSSLEERVLIGRWLNHVKAQDKILAWLDDELSRENQNLYLLRVDALAQLGRWDEIEASLKRFDGLPIPEFNRKIYLARALYEQGDEAGGTVLWNKALAPGADQEKRLEYAARYAEMANFDQLAQKTYQRISRNPVHSRLGYRGLLRLARKHNDETRILRLLAEMEERFPHDLAVSNDTNYYQLLLGQNQRAAARNAYNLSQQHSNVLAYKVTKALALLRETRYQEAYKELDLDRVPWNELDSTIWRVVKAATLRAVQKNEEARRIEKTLDPRYLLKAERELLQSFGKED